MSDGLNLNNELFNDVLAAITRHDPDGHEDMLVNLQYLAAIAGYFCADYPGPKEERDELMGHLAELMQHICNDRIAQRQPKISVTMGAQPAPPKASSSIKGHSTSTEDPAVGIWTPEL